MRSSITLVATLVRARFVAHLHLAATQNAQPHATFVALVTWQMDAPVAMKSVTPITVTEGVDFTSATVVMDTRTAPSQSCWILKLALVV